MTAANRLWGEERIGGEILKLPIHAAKRAGQQRLRGAYPSRCSRQTWTAFLRPPAHYIWAGDLLPVADLFFRPLHTYFVIALGSHRVVHVVICQPTDVWVAQQNREATPFDQRPQYLIRHDSQSDEAVTCLAEPPGRGAWR